MEAAGQSVPPGRMRGSEAGTEPDEEPHVVLIGVERDRTVDAEVAEEDAEPDVVPRARVGAAEAVAVEGPAARSVEEDDPGRVVEMVCVAPRPMAFSPSTRRCRLTSPSRTVNCVSRSCTCTLVWGTTTVSPIEKGSGWLTSISSRTITVRPP